jgi:geranylgeranyl diphosphate synthase type II
MFDLKVFLNSQCHRVDATLDRVMPPEATPPAILHQAMRYAVFSGGKRLRPALCTAAAEAVGGTAEAAALPAAAIELLHTYTLVHDDLPCMDDDDMRRGRPTVHKVFGEANAVLAGDALQALAFEVAARAPALPPYSPTQFVLELAAAAGSTGVVGGQVEDMAAVGTRPGEDRVHFIHLHKTADLFRASLRMGAIAGNASHGQLDALTRFGVSLGMAFQITDDLLDEHPSPADGEMETTCLMIWDTATAREKARQFIEAALTDLKILQPPQAESLAGVARFVLERTS